VLGELAARTALAFVSLASSLAGLVLGLVQPSATAAQESEAPRPEPRVFGRVLALCVGIDRYENDIAIPSLRFAQADARAMAALLEETYGYEVSLLLGPEATRAGIEQALQRISAAIEASPGVTSEPAEAGSPTQAEARGVEPLGEAAVERSGIALVLYLAGHGTTTHIETKAPDGKATTSRRGFFLPYDTRGALDGSSPLAVYEQTALDFGQLTQSLLERHAPERPLHIVMILDACFSGFAARPQPRGATINVARVLYSHPTRQVMTGGTEQQTTNEHDSLGHGLFTWGLLRELERGQQGEILTAGELFSNSRVNVLKKAHELGLAPGSQEPQWRQLIESDGDFVFVPVTASDEALVAVVAADRAAASRGGAVRASEADVAAVREQARQDAPVSDREAEERFERLREAAARGDPAAMEALFHCYGKGIGTERDTRRASSWGQEALELETSDMVARIGAGLRLLQSLEGIELSKKGLKEILEDPSTLTSAAEITRVLFAPKESLAGSLAKARALIQRHQYTAAQKEVRHWVRTVMKTKADSPLAKSLRTALDDIDAALLDAAKGKRAGKEKALDLIEELEQALRTLEEQQKKQENGGK
jgi:TPR repeat protein